MAEPIAIVAIITAIGALATITFKYVRHSECLGCFKCDTRTPPESPVIQPPPAPPPPTPQTHHKHKHDSEFDLQIAEIEV